MNIFWLLAAGLVVVITCAYLLVVLPRLRNNQSDTGIASQGITAILAGKNAPVVVAGIAIPLFAIALYFAWSSKQDASSPIVAVKSQSVQVSPEHENMIKALAARLEKDPNDGKGWVMLARSYATMGRFSESASAYEKAANLIQNDAKLLADYADILAMVNGRNLQGKPLELVYSALKIDPNNTKGLLLAGKAAYQAGDYSHAVGYWQKLMQILPPDSPTAKQVADNIDQARALMKK